MSVLLLICHECHWKEQQRPADVIVVYDEGFDAPVLDVV